jgi:tRNA(fMet)-specific endonuclease VapC
MSYLVDSDWVVDWLHGKPPAVELLTALAVSGLAISLITYGEIYEGIFFGRDPKQSERVFRQFLRSVDVLPLTKPIMRRFARIRGQLRQQGLLIPDPDLLNRHSSLQSR